MLNVVLTTQSPSKEWTTSFAAALGARSLKLLLELALPTANRVLMTGLLLPQAANGNFPSVSLQPLLAAGLGIRGAKSPVPTQLKCKWECKRARARINPCAAHWSRREGQQHQAWTRMNHSGSVLLPSRQTTSNPNNPRMSLMLTDQRLCKHLRSQRSVER